MGRTDLRVSPGHYSNFPSHRHKQRDHLTGKTVFNHSLSTPNKYSEEPGHVMSQARCARCWIAASPAGQSSFLVSSWEIQQLSLFPAGKKIPIGNSCLQCINKRQEEPCLEAGAPPPLQTWTENYHKKGHTGCKCKLYSGFMNWANEDQTTRTLHILHVCLNRINDLLSPAPHTLQ